WGLAGFMTLHPTADEPLMPVPVVLGQMSGVPVELACCEGILARKGEKITKSVTLAESVKAPVSLGQQLGTLTVSQQGRVIAEVPIVAGADVPKLGLGGILSRLLRHACMCR
ncbi:MAG: D-alanyl-D-alanine carboxypeptidase, partial [Clostridia bacterium]|nr:D-alanyl-D-alanine carboxypeptidase [Clostridia bacterium]